MKKAIRIALALVMALNLLTAAALAEEVASKGFNLLDHITVQARPAEGPEEEISEASSEEGMVAASEEPIAEAPVAPRSVSIVSNIAPDEIQLGDTIVLTAVLSGFDGATVEIVWERMVDGAWLATGQTGATLAFTVDEYNPEGAWRVAVTVLAEAQPAAQTPAS